MSESTCLTILQTADLHGQLETHMHHADPADPGAPLGNDVVGNHLFAPYTVLNRGGVRIGLLAYNDPH